MYSTTCLAPTYSCKSLCLPWSRVHDPCFRVLAPCFLQVCGLKYECQGCLTFCSILEPNSSLLPSLHQETQNKLTGLYVLHHASSCSTCNLTAASGLASCSCMLLCHDLLCCIAVANDIYLPPSGRLALSFAVKSPVYMHLQHRLTSCRGQHLSDCIYSSAYAQSSNSRQCIIFLSMPAGYFEAPGAMYCPLDRQVPKGALPNVTMVFCAVDGSSKMKVGTAQLCACM